MSKTAIEWTQESWNPVVGCSIKSPGCAHCYAMPMAARIEAANAAARAEGKKVPAPQYDGSTKLVNGHPVWTGKLALAGDHILLAPLKRKKPTTYFVNSMGDLFHEDVPDPWIDRVFDVMEHVDYDRSDGAEIRILRHTYQILTKRAQRMRDYMIARYAKKQAYADQFKICPTPAMRNSPAARDARMKAKPEFWRNIWLGVSAERQQEADERIPQLYQTQAAIRFASFEPLLGAIVIPPKMKLQQPSGLVVPVGLDWAIAGGESGPGARPMHPDWARSLRDQCKVAGIAFFFKQWGAWARWEPRYPATDVAYLSGDGRSSGDPRHAGASGVPMVNVGKHKAGRLLDGVEYSEMPRLCQVATPGAAREIRP